MWSRVPHPDLKPACSHAISVSILSKEMNKKLTARNMKVQLLTVFIELECHNAQRYRQKDMTRHYDANSRSHCITV